MNIDAAVTAAIEQFGNAHPDILGVFVFDSVAAGRAREDSDIDIAILLDRTPTKPEAVHRSIALALELEDTLSREADVVILNEASPMVRHQVFRNGKLLFTRNLARVKRFVSEAVIEYLDEIVLLERLQNRLITRALNGR